MIDNTLEKIYRNILNSLSGGTVPKEGLGYITVGREREVDSLMRDTQIIQDGGAAFRFVVGDYGSGKTFLLQTIKEYAVKKNFVVAEVDLSPERSLVGNTMKKKGLATYRELMANVSNKTNQSGRALSKILDAWIGKTFEKAAYEVVASQSDVVNMELYTETLLNKECSVLQDMAYGFEFTQALRAFWKASRSTDINEKAEMREAALRWFRGDYRTNQESKHAVGINATVTDENWFDYIMIWSAFFVMAGYNGFIVLIDEMINIYKAAHSVTRQQNYEKMLTMYNATLQGKAENLGIILGGIPMSIYDKKRGVFSYEAMRSRLSASTYKDSSLIHMYTPIIKVLPLTKEEMYVLLEKLSDIHAELYEYQSVLSDEELLGFVKMAYMKRETSFVTPRTMIRDFIQVLDVKYQNPDKTIKDILEAYRFAIDEEQSYEDIFD